jgi:hypothetical protein
MCTYLVLFLLTPISKYVARAAQNVIDSCTTREGQVAGMFCSTQLISPIFYTPLTTSMIQEPAPPTAMAISLSALTARNTGVLK